MNYSVRYSDLKLSPDMTDLVQRRTMPFLDNVGTRTLSDLLIEAYLQGMKDAVQARAALAPELEAALRPFADFADPRNKIPPDTILTAGSSMARKQITMADCYAARAALAPEQDK